MVRMYNDKLNNDTGNKGITLVEVLVSIAILGIVSSMISAILMGGMNFFRKQSTAIDLQSDSQLIMASMSTAILEGTDFILQEKNADGRKLLVFTTGDAAGEAKGRQYIWVEESTGSDKGYLYIYDVGAAVDYNKGNCLSQFVTYMSVMGKALSETVNPAGDKVYTYVAVESATEVNSIYVEFTLANSQGEVTQSFEIKPRNTAVGYKKIIPGAE